MQKLVVLSGAGISAESGISTFRDSGGLWENHNVMDVASPYGWKKNPELVLNFYNARRKQALDAQPNEGHKALKRLEEKFDVTIITQNIDNLHEKAGSSKVIHLHGQLSQSRSTLDANLVYEVDGWELNLGDKCEKGSQLRPNVVWFGESVPMMEEAARTVAKTDFLIITGTSLQVYPAAGLLNFRTPGIPVYLVDPQIPDTVDQRNIIAIPEKAGKGLPALVDQLLAIF